VPGLSPKLPLSIDEVDGYATTKNFKEVARQNLKMIVLTAPGERVMIPGFGVGIRNYLFENATQSTFETIRRKIKEQVAIYAPYISINSVNFAQDRNDFGFIEIDPSNESNFVGVIIDFSIPKAFISDTLILEI
jgi:phage baseplate assembly protein W